MNEHQRLTEALSGTAPKRLVKRQPPGGGGVKLLASYTFRHGITLWYVVRILENGVSQTVRFSTEEAASKWAKSNGCKTRLDFSRQSPYDLWDRHFPAPSA